MEATQTDHAGECPRLRPVEAFPLKVSGETMIGLRDPSGLAPNMITVPEPVFFLLTMFDGRHTLRDMQTAFMQRYGQMITSDQIQDIAAKLDECALLDSPHFIAWKEQVEQEFHELKVRPTSHAGLAYEEDPQLLTEQLTEYFTSAGGPGLPDGAASDGLELRGLIAPHIDFQRGGACYAWAYKALAEHPPADVYVILGTAHQPMPAAYSFLRKDFATPWGVVPADYDFLDRLEAKLGDGLYAGEFWHKAEHSIEFQVVFLRYMLGDEHPFRIVPLLCGSLHEEIEQQLSPLDNPAVQRLLEGLRQVIAESGQRVCVIASADLAHIGPEFGAAEEVGEAELEDCEQKDEQLLEQVAAGQAEEFFATVSREGDQRHICGLAPIYYLLRTVEADSAELLSYMQAASPVATVTFASVAFYQQLEEEEDNE